MKRFITLGLNNEIIGIRNGYSPVGNEIESELGELGDIMQKDGVFITPEPESIPVQASIGEQILAETQYQTALIEMNMLGVL